MRGKGRRWSGHDSGKWGRCLSSAAAGDLVTVWGRWAGRDGGERTRREVLADRTGASLRGRSVGRMAGQLRTGAVRLGVESLAAVPGRD